MQEHLDRIRRAVATDALKKSALAREAGLTVDTLKDVDRGDWNPQSSTVEKLIGALDRIAAKLAA